MKFSHLVGVLIKNFIRLGYRMKYLIDKLCCTNIIRLKIDDIYSFGS